MKGTHLPATASNGQEPTRGTILVKDMQAELAQDARQLRHTAFVCQPHDQILNSLLKEVVKIDFRAEAGFDPDDEDAKLRKEHYLVITCEKLLALVEQNQWGLCQRNGTFYLYNGAFWKSIDRDDLKDFLKKVAEQMGADKFRVRHFEFADQLLKQFIVSAHLPTPIINRATVKINLQNGTFEIGPDRQHLRPPNPKDFLTYQLSFPYDSAADAPIWRGYLNKVLPDEACQNILAEYLGYVFISSKRLKLEKALLLSGEGSNGKSVFFEVVTALLGPENVSSYSLEKLTTEETYRAKIADKLLNYCSEISANLDVNYFKALTSNESVSARYLYGQPFQIEDYAKLISNANKLPTVSEHTHAWFRRFLIVPFSVTIPDQEQDVHLPAKIIKAELSGVFNWILAGLRRLLQQDGFTESKIVRDQTELYKRQSDTVRLFMEEGEYKPDLERYTTLKELYRDYQMFCRDDGHRNPVNKLTFRKRVESYGILTGDRNIGKVVFVQKPGMLP